MNLQPIADKSAWLGSELDLDRGWVLAPDWDGIERGEPKALGVLKDISHALEHGRGIVLLRGFNLDGAGEPALEPLRTRYLAFARRLGEPVAQNQAEGLLRDIRDTGGPRVESPAALNWHNDRADRVGLLTVSQAAEGGRSRVVSATAVHDRMLAERPELVEALYQPYPRSSTGDEVGSVPKVYAAGNFDTM